MKNHLQQIVENLNLCKSDLSSAEAYYRKACCNYDLADDTAVVSAMIDLSIVNLNKIIDSL